MIGFSTSNYDSEDRCRFWTYILRSKFDIELDTKGDVIGPELIVMQDQNMAQWIADHTDEIETYQKSKGVWKRYKQKR